jgi:hypothetical protein
MAREGKLDQLFALAIDAHEVPADHPKCLIVGVVDNVGTANWITRAADPLVVYDHDFPVFNASVVDEAPEIASFGIDRERTGSDLTDVRGNGIDHDRLGTGSQTSQ